jgi:hypothetical protein
MLGATIDRLSHAYLLLGDADFVHTALLEHLTSMGVGVVGNPDFHLFEEEMFGIGEARLLSTQALGRAFGERQMFVLAPARFSIEAQNALLKTLEEPTPHTHFFIIARDEASIIPTLRSRMQTVRINESNVFSPQHLISEAESFLNLSLKDRLDFAKDFADKEKSLPIFLDQLLTILKSKEIGSAIKNAYNVSLYAGDRSASPRLVLEHLALVL